LTGGFESKQEVIDWLKVAVGENLKYAIASGKHAKRALELNPLQANAYLQLAETGFLLGHEPGFEKECIAQALKLWPFDGQVLFIAGRDAAAEGDLKKMMALWKAAFHSQPIWQERIIQCVMANVESNPVPLMFDQFDPDIAALKRIAKIVETSGTDRDRVQALTRLVTELVARAKQPKNSDRVDDWLKAGAAFDKLGRPDDVTACLESAYKAEPSSFLVRFEFGVWLHRQRKHREALEHFEWCHLMAPDHPKLDRLIQQAERAAYSGIWQASGIQSEPSRTTLPNNPAPAPLLFPQPGDAARPALQ
jgi:tetratricopeptide (TPR) repeat protein